MYITRQLGYLAFSLNDNNLAFVSGKTGSKITLSALIPFSKNLIYGDRIFFFWQQITRYPRELTSLSSGTSSPRCSASLTSLIVLAVCAEGLHGHVTARSPPPWLANAMPAVLVQRASSIAVAQTGAPLCQETKKGNGSDLSMESFCTSNKQMRDTQWEQAFRNSTNTVIAHGQKQQHYLRNLILIQVASLIGLTLETPLTCAGQKYLQ